jgi:GNAT superfamily N-acetyltransferase
VGFEAFAKAIISSLVVATVESESFQRPALKMSANRHQLPKNDPAMHFRKATENDLSTIVEMIADDDLGKTRENFQIPLPAEYIRAFECIIADQNQELIVVENENGEIIGTLQLSFIQYLTYRGGIRAQIEAVRIRKDQSGHGIGKAMFSWAINRAKERKAHLLQLTTDKKRPEAIKFYEGLGFKATHEGMKIHFELSEV